MLSVEFCGIALRTPLVLASGIFVLTDASLRRMANCGAGAITIKSISREAREGHENPTVLTYEAGMVNAIGYANPGLEEAKKEFAAVGQSEVPVFASIIGTDVDDFAYMAEQFLSSDFAAVEIPLSCPHTPGFGVLAGQNTPEASYHITRAVRERTDLPVIVKLFPGDNLCEIARAAEAGGAAAINMGNSHGPGMLINIEAAAPVLAFKSGGVSGPAVKPLTLRAVYDLYQAINIPIIATGGVMNWRDAIEMIMAGACAVGIGSALYYVGQDVFFHIEKGMQAFMEKHRYTSITEMIGKAHEN